MDWLVMALIILILIIINIAIILIKRANGIIKDVDRIVDSYELRITKTLEFLTELEPDLKTGSHSPRWDLVFTEIRMRLEHGQD